MNALPVRRCCTCCPHLSELFERGSNVQSEGGFDHGSAVWRWPSNSSIAVPEGLQSASSQWRACTRRSVVNIKQRWTTMPAPSQSAKRWAARRRAFGCTSPIGPPAVSACSCRPSGRGHGSAGRGDRPHDGRRRARAFAATARGVAAQPITLRRWAAIGCSIALCREGSDSTPRTSVGTPLPERSVRPR